MTVSSGEGSGVGSGSQIMKLKDMIADLKSTLASREGEIATLKAELAAAGESMKSMSANMEKNLELAVSKKELEVKLDLHKRVEEAYDKGFNRAMSNFSQVQKLLGGGASSSTSIFGGAASP